VVAIVGNWSKMAKNKASFL